MSDPLSMGPRRLIKRLLPDLVVELIRDMKAKPNELTVLANRYGSDKGTRHYMRHNYTRVYDPLFSPLRQKPLRFLEIGLLNISDRTWKNREARLAGGSVGGRAPSLEMWSEYFPRGEIIGFDINDFANVSIPRVKILRGSMESRADLSTLVASGGAFDVVLEDASHASHHQQISLGYLFRHVKPGGLYIIEDLQFQPIEVEHKGAVKTLDLLQKFTHTGKIESPYIEPEEAAFLEAEIASIEFYDSISPQEALLGRDALAVIRRKGA